MHQGSFGYSYNSHPYNLSLWSPSSTSLKRLGVAVNIEINYIERLLPARELQLQRPGQCSTHFGICPSLRPSLDTKVGTHQHISDGWMGRWKSEWCRPKDIDSALKELWFFHPPFIHLSTHSFVHLSPGGSPPARSLCWIWSCRPETSLASHVPSHDVFWMAAKKLRAKYNFFIKEAILTQVWAIISNPFFSLGLIFDYS